MNLRALALLSSLFVTSGCATNADLLKLQRDLRETRALAADTQEDIETLKRRVDTLDEKKAEGGRSTSSGLDRRLSSLETRLAALEAGATQPPLSTTGEPGVVPPSPQSPIRGTPAAAIEWKNDEKLVASGGANEIYKGGMDFYRQGRFDLAVAKFREFVQASPKSDAADNAQYWIGESYYNQRDYNRAIIELNEVLLKYPQGDRVSGALLALATAFADSGDKIDARLILQKLISDHAQSEEATIGRQKLQELTD